MNSDTAKEIVEKLDDLMCWRIAQYTDLLDRNRYEVAAKNLKQDLITLIAKGCEWNYLDGRTNYTPLHLDISGRLAHYVNSIVEAMNVVIMEYLQSLLAVVSIRER